MGTVLLYTDCLERRLPSAPSEDNSKLFEEALETWWLLPPSQKVSLTVRSLHLLYEAESRVLGQTCGAMGAALTF